MNGSDMTSKPSQLLSHILNFVEYSSGLTSQLYDTGEVTIQQSVDGKLFRFRSIEVTEVLDRTDSDGKAFIQINFQSGNKVLFTDTLVGFKPRETIGLDMNKIPRVVTTPDLISVFEAIEDSIGSEATPDTEIEILKKVFQAILLGGEGAGFDLSFEKRWLASLTASRFRASA